MTVVVFNSYHASSDKLESLIPSLLCIFQMQVRDDGLHHLRVSE